MAAGVGVAREGGGRTVPVRRDIKALTGLRAVAATLVVLFHFQFFIGPYVDAVPMLRPLIAAGWTGVELFFVLSGFVITYTYADRLARPTPGAVWTFLLNRVARVWPAWALVTVFMGGWLWVLRSEGVDADVIAKHPVTDLATMVRQLSMTQMWGQHGTVGGNYVFPGWSISAEWAAYLAFPLVLLLLRPLRRLPAGVLLALSIAAMSPLSVRAFTEGTPDFQQSWLFRIVCGFTAGMLAAMALRRVEPGGWLERTAPRLQWASLLLVFAGMSWAMWRRSFDMTFDYAGIVAVVFPLLVVSLALSEQGAARFLATPAMVYGGRISYCLYLVHYVVLDVTMTIWWQNPADVKVLTPGLTLASIGLIIVSFLLAAAVHHGVEEPGRRLILRLVDAVAAGARRVTGRPAAVAVAATEVSATLRRHPLGASVPAVARTASPRPEQVLAGDPRTERLPMLVPLGESGMAPLQRVPAERPAHDLATR